MSTTRSLLVATDFSDDARCAVYRAAALAAEQGTRLELLHVISGPSLYALRELFGSPAAAETALVAEAQQSLNDLAMEVAERSAAAVTAHIEVGQVLNEILAASERADMLVMGAHGLNPLRDLILGTTADRLLKKCKRPVLVTKRQPQDGYRRVLVPVDFSPHSIAALRMALLVAPRAAITIVHAFDVPFEGKLWVAGVAEEEIERYRAQARSQALSNIDTLIKDAGGNRYRILRSVDQGDASRMILANEEALGADLIVIGKHGRSAIEELFLGSVTRHILSNSKCDVLVVPEQPLAAGT